MGTLAFLHGLSARVLVVYAVFLGLWGAYGYFRHARISGGYRSSYLIMAAITPLQGLFGGILFLFGSRPGEILHVVYGVFAVLFVPGAYLYARGGDARREALVLAGASWVVSIAYFRGIATG